MLRIHFTEVDLARTRLAGAPDPLWELAASLHRLQSSRGRWAFAQWYDTARRELRERGVERAVRTELLPLYSKGVYFPDFLTPIQAAEGLESGLAAILDTRPERVVAEIGRLSRSTAPPRWAAEIPGTRGRQELVRMLRTYHEAVITPHSEHMEARIEAERVTRFRALMTGGVEGMLAGFGPMMRWESPVLYVRYPAEDRDLHLNGRGLRLVPSYFSWGAPVSFADPELQPVLCYPVFQEPSASALDADGGPPDRALTALLGQARAAVLRTAASGATTGELARAVGVSASSASRHAGVLRDAGLITSSRNGASVLHTLTPVGASVLRAAVRRAREGSATRRRV
ncbi:winged helix-turn-helix domain-containing protein [Streptomyces sp. NPDC048389]|uniref:ArsR/SmtB family transcription factor n=1 Tax=Streptomyces sp. NPDC048389 TaxID=3154622 RepID=UPI0034567A31